MSQKKLSDLIRTTCKLMALLNFTIKVNLLENSIKNKVNLIFIWQ